ncbi:MAG TPA: radical SAM family heme chaperone HemW, partial [Acholeplasmataceae bacterium]|nr:radical SAM family heme chaperone HemW [Acholeplasmataceae bacterium]
MEALYIHIPFCRKICTYCDFYKMVAKDSVKTKYVEYLLKELRLKKDLLNDLKTVYIGGGTPTALPLNLLDFFLYHLTKEIDLNSVIEFTIEANPSDITKELVNVLTKYNINRVSLGVQSFNDEKLKFLGRDHDEKTIKKAIKTLQRGGLKNINVDLIYGTPNDSFRKVKKDLKKIINLGAKHISTYSLILEKKTILYHLF